MEINAFPKSEAFQQAKEIDHYQAAINSLSKSSSFVFFNLNLSHEELMALEKIKIKFPQEYNNFGKLEMLHKGRCCKYRNQVLN